MQSNDDFRAQLLLQAKETNRLLKSIEQGIATLVRNSVDPYADAFNAESKPSAQNRALLEQRYGIAFDKLTESEAELLAERLPADQREHFKRSGKYAVKFPLMALLADSQDRRKVG